MEVTLNSNILKLLGETLVGQANNQGGGVTGIMNMVFPFIIIFGIFYFLIIRPQKKQQRKHKEMIDHLQKGDNVMMNCGIRGRIGEIKDNLIKLEIAPKVVVTIQKTAIASRVKEEI